MTVTTVDRPTDADGVVFSHLVETATTKRAIVVELNEGDDVFKWTSRMRMRLSKLETPLVLRYRQDKSSGKITCWAETKGEANERRRKTAK